MTFAELWKEDLTGTTFKGTLDLKNKGLTSLKGMPETVTGNLYISGNPLRNLKYCTEYVEGDFDCDNMPELVDFKGAPKSVGGLFGAVKNPRLSRLAGLTPKIGKDLILSNNKLHTLVGASKISVVGGLFLDGNKFPSVDAIIKDIVECEFWVKGEIFTDFETNSGEDITKDDLAKYARSKKLGKFKDFLEL